MFKNPFRKITHHEIAQEHRDHAERALLTHEADAEYHLAQARMYRERIQRLNNVVPLPKGGVR
jgi:hypothetical protein